MAAFQVKQGRTEMETIDEKEQRTLRALTKIAQILVEDEPEKTRESVKCALAQVMPVLRDSYAYCEVTDAIRNFAENEIVRRMQIFG
jgi:hypothetical protein